MTEVVISGSRTGSRGYVLILEKFTSKFEEQPCLSSIEGDAMSGGLQDMLYGLNMSFFEGDLLTVSPTSS